MALHFSFATGFAIIIVFEGGLQMTTAGVAIRKGNAVVVAYETGTTDLEGN